MTTITLDDLRVIIQESLVPVIARLDGIDRRLDTVDRRLDTMDRRLDTMDRRLDTVDGQFAILAAKQMNATGTRKSKIQPVGKIASDQDGNTTYVPFASNISLPATMGDHCRK